MKIAGVFLKVSACLGVGCIMLIVLLSGCSDNGDPGGDDNNYGKADDVFIEEPFYLTGAFDGSQRFGMWVDTMAFCRRISSEYSMPLRFSYLINTCYFDRNVERSWIGTAKSREEEIVRWALVQQAINEGHEIGSHTVRHQDGSTWTEEAWRDEFAEFHQLTSANLFEPVYDEFTWEPVFPHWEALEGAEAGQFGTLCEVDSDCDSNKCLPVTASKSFCSQRCNKNLPCPEGSACGAPDWNRSTDVCVLLPKLPVEYNEEILFDQDGNANLEHPALVPYKMTGFRAPQLGHNAALYTILEEFGFLYDTSQILRMGPPRKTMFRGELFENLYQFALMKNPGSATIPMDYNYYYNEVSGDRMLSDYKQSIIDAHNKYNHQPWNIGHHFALWKGAAYWTAMKGAFEFAAKGCPDNEGNLQCGQVQFVTFLDLVGILDALEEDKEDELGPDIFTFDYELSDEQIVSSECHCEEDEVCFCE
jgi:peptidoglycan/xylan/chitin deacetylase (PgdA/CDA1 family)